jgi:glucose-6-phosphate 1-dehydrogenase
MRKLLPALYRRHCDGLVPPGSRIVGLARSPYGDAEYRAQA